MVLIWYRVMLQMNSDTKDLQSAFCGSGGEKVGYGRKSADDEKAPSCLLYKKYDTMLSYVQYGTVRYRTVVTVLYVYNIDTGHSRRYRYLLYGMHVDVLYVDKYQCSAGEARRRPCHGDD